jgi:hypothetical protein
MLAMRRSQAKPSDPFDLLWLDFRDAFGLLWSLRLQERVNAAAKSAGWEIELAWTGFVDKRPKAAQGIQGISIPQELRPVMSGLLRRFVSKEWIAARLAEDID